MIVCTYFAYHADSRQKESILLQDHIIAQLETTQEQLTRLEKHLTHSEGLASFEIDKSLEIQQALEDINLPRLPSGLYQLTTSVPLDGSEKTFTIYHMKTEVSASGETYPLQIGVAISGYLSTPKVYVDIDSDGRVDQEAMYAVTAWLPLQQLYSGSINPSVSQKIYNSFILKHHDAEFMDVANISSHGSSLVKTIWQAVTEKGGELFSNPEKSRTSSSDSNIDRF